MLLIASVENAQVVFLLSQNLKFIWEKGNANLMLVFSSCFFQKGKKEKPKAAEIEDAVEKEEVVSPKAKKVKKKAEPSEVETEPPKSKKVPKKEEPSPDDGSPKSKSGKKKKESQEKSVDSSKSKKVKSEEPEEDEDTAAPKPKKMKKEKGMNGEIGEKSPKIKNGFAHPGSDSNSSVAASEESNTELEQVKFHFQINRLLVLVGLLLEGPLKGVTCHYLLWEG